MAVKIERRARGVLLAKDLGECPQELVYKGVEYYRFHDFLYVADPIECLDPDQVIEICRLRNQYFSREQKAINDLVRGDFVRCTQLLKPRSVLELGPGRRPLFSERIEYFKYCLVELDPLAVDWLKRSGYSASTLGLNSVLPYRSASFDLVVALFVFHFPMGEFQLLELLRVLSPQGVLFFNMYRKSRKSRRELLRLFEGQGLTVIRGASKVPIGHCHEYWAVGSQQKVTELSEGMRLFK